MGLYIKGMEMPSCCMFCPVSNNMGCGLANPPIVMTSKEMLADRPDWCPLVPVPPHGDLIERDKLVFEDDYYGWRDKQVIKHAPTIIPASEEGET